MTLKYIWRSFSLGCHFHVHFSYPWHAFALHGLPAIAELFVIACIARSVIVQCCHVHSCHFVLDCRVLQWPVLQYKRPFMYPRSQKRRLSGRTFGVFFSDLNVLRKICYHTSRRRDRRRQEPMKVDGFCAALVTSWSGLNFNVYTWNSWLSSKMSTHRLLTTVFRTIPCEKWFFPTSNLFCGVHYKPCIMHMTVCIFRRTSW